jgi:hypothetical protein
MTFTRFPHPIRCLRSGLAAFTLTAISHAARSAPPPNLVHVA